MYKHMGISVPPHLSPRVFPDRGPFYMQQPDPSMPSFTQPITSMPIFTQPIPSMHASGSSYTQLELSMSHFPQTGQTMTLFPLSDLSMQAPGTSYTLHSPSPSTSCGPNFTEVE
ncbi:hypothetical protein Hanom_Chr16g01501561 [Helianthus anomalus]